MSKLFNNFIVFLLVFNVSTLIYIKQAITIVNRTLFRLMFLGIFTYTYQFH